MYAILYLTLVPPYFCSSFFCGFLNCNFFCPISEYLLIMLKSKQATVNLFQMQHAQVVSLPVNCQSLCENAKRYEPGQQFSEFVKNLPKDDCGIEVGSCEASSAQIDR